MAANVFDDRTTQDIIQMVRLFRRNGWMSGKSLPQFNQPTPLPIFFTNDSGEEIPPYACMQITGTEEIGGQNFLVVDKPTDVTADIGEFVFNNHSVVADDAEGVIQPGPVFRAFQDTGGAASSSGQCWGPVSGQWYLDRAAQGFAAVGDDDIDDDVLRVMAVPRNIAVFETPLGGIAAKSGSTLSSANCTLLDVSGGTRATTSTTVEVYNEFFGDISGGVDIIAAKINGIWIVIAEDCDDDGGITPVGPTILEHTINSLTVTSYTFGTNLEEYLYVIADDANVTVLLSVTNAVECNIKLISTSGYTLTIDGNGDNIDGSSALVLSSQYDAVRLAYSQLNAEWYIQ